MNYKRIWKIADAVMIALSAVLLASQLFKLFQLPDALIRVFGVADLIALIVFSFSFVKAGKSSKR